MGVLSKQYMVKVWFTAFIVKPQNYACIRMKKMHYDTYTYMHISLELDVHCPVSLIRCFLDFRIKSSDIL